MTFVTRGVHPVLQRSLQLTRGEITTLVVMPLHRCALGTGSQWVLVFVTPLIFAIEKFFPLFLWFSLDRLLLPGNCGKM
jgi:hypothetical protein